MKCQLTWNTRLQADNRQQPDAANVYTADVWKAYSLVVRLGRCCKEEKKKLTELEINLSSGTTKSCLVKSERAPCFIGIGSLKTTFFVPTDQWQPALQLQPQVVCSKRPRDIEACCVAASSAPAASWEM